MRSLARALLFFLALGLLPTCVLGQAEQKQGTGVITGRVMVGDKPAQGVVVIASPGESGPERREVARGSTDYEGNYRLTGLAAGRYSISPVAPTLIGQSSDSPFGGSGRMVIMTEGETVDKIDFNMTRGGVVTGRITDAEGRPVIEERVQLTPYDNQARVRYGGLSNPFMFQTDDRGVYRIYGVPPGRYIVSVGASGQEGIVRVGAGGRSYFQRTYYPGETDIKRAAPVEVPEGGEVKDVDIKLGQKAQTFTVAGRVIDADTGRPVSNVVIGYGSYNPNERRMNAFGFGQSRTDERGQFSLEGVMPGSFAAFVWSGTELYSDPLPFQVTDADVTGLELKARRGASISGVAVIEGTSDKRVLARLTQLALAASVQSRAAGPPGLRPATINPDGSFQLTGLSPGRASLFLYGADQPKDLRLVRVERNGVPQPNGIEITPGAEITGVRVVFEYGSGSIRGTVRAEGGEMPEGARFLIMVHKPGEDANSRPLAYTQPDTRGRFILEGLAPGEYQLTLRAVFPPTSNQRPALIKQNVTVANGMEAESTFTLDLTQREKPPEVPQQ
jgi:hypothetical protein